MTHLVTMANESKYHLLGHRDDENESPSSKLSLDLNDKDYGEPPSFLARLFPQWLCNGVASLVVLALLCASFFSGVQYGISKTMPLTQSPYCK